MKVSKGIYILIAILIGGIGGHHFYSGRWLRGLVYLALVWTYLPLLFSIFDIMGAVFKRPDKHGQIQV